MKRPVSRKLLRFIARTAEQKCQSLDHIRKFKPYCDWPPLTGSDYGTYVHAAIVSLFEKDAP
jgi:hypothetical protein